MSIGAYAVGDAAISAQRGTVAVVVKKPPVNRLVTAKADTTELPEPR